ncbi:MAG: FkbM family methyltransferase [Chloroflexota bacterium]
MAIVHMVLRDEGPGTLVDVGAHFGSSLRRFADDGWRVIAIEPDPQNRAVLVERMQGRGNVVIDGRAIAERDGEVLALYTSDVSTGISALAPFHPSHRATSEVETVRLDTLLASEDHVTVLKTDLEGYDLRALRTFPWDRLHPRAVVCEFEDRKTVPLGYTYHDLGSYLVQEGYSVFVSEWFPVVEYGRRHRWRSLRPYPSELEDRAAWGNFIAVDEDLRQVVSGVARRHER